MKRQMQKKAILKSMSAMLTLALLSSCVVESTSSSGKRTAGAASIKNSPSTVGLGEGRILHHNPIILTGDYKLAPDFDLSRVLEKKGDFITRENTLTGICIQNTTNCISVKKDKVSNQINSIGGKWAFETETKEFSEVQLYGHMDRIVSKFHNDLDEMQRFASIKSGAVPSGYRSSYPSSSTLYSTKAHWLGGSNLVGHAECDIDKNAFYEPSNFSMCFGAISELPSVKFAHDPSVIYHEIGHAFQDVMLNMRNVASGSVTQKTPLGVLFYDEAGSIGEGVSDYFSYYMNQRKHFGEWALGRFLNQSRPLSESDPLHAPGISTNVGERLRYPTYLNYDPNEADKTFEDIHYAGQIISHYLVAVTEDITAKCSISRPTAIKYIFWILSETYAELGDLTAKGCDHASCSQKLNLNSNNAFLWSSMVNPINFRSFAQTFARKMLRTLGDSSMGLCSGGAYSKDSIETMLDEYGLLLFKSYNENGNSSNEPAPNTFDGHQGSHTLVSPTNRKQTVLIKKDLLKINPAQGETKAFIFDDRAEMVSTLQSLITIGDITGISEHLKTDLPYNNGNAEISPGEFLGISLNLFNDSNSTMAGVQVLANDWDHVKESNMCNTFSDNFPSSTEGAAQLNSGEGVAGGCDYTTRSNGADGDQVAPVCFVQLNDQSSTRWVNQEEFRHHLNLEPKNCLGGSTSTKDCFIRFPRGADQSIISKIDPKETWVETIFKGNKPDFKTNQVIFMEVSPSVPPGTTFHCRFRARFTNCEDCFIDSANGNDDYVDHEYSGAKPFTILPFEFTVID